MTDVITILIGFGVVFALLAATAYLAKKSGERRRTHRERHPGPHAIACDQPGNCGTCSCDPLSDEEP